MQTPRRSPLGRLAGFGGAPNMGHDPRGRRHSSHAWLDLIADDKAIVRGRKLVVQTVETFQNGGTPAFVEVLDAIPVGKQAGMPIAPIMIYGDDVSHVVTEEGIAYLYKAEGNEERRRALAAVAGVSPIGLRAVPHRNRRAAQARHRCIPGRHRRSSPRRQALPAGRTQHGRPGGVVRQPLLPTRALSELVMTLMPASSSGMTSPSAPLDIQPTAMRIAELARQALIAEAELTPKPGLVDRRGPGAHRDLTLATMRLSAMDHRALLPCNGMQVHRGASDPESARAARRDRPQCGAGDAHSNRRQQYS